MSTSLTLSDRPDPRTWISIKGNLPLRDLLHDICACQVHVDAAVSNISGARQTMANLAALKAEATSDQMRDAYSRRIGGMLEHIDEMERGQESWQANIDALWEQHDELRDVPMRVPAMAAE